MDPQESYTQGYKYGQRVRALYPKDPPPVGNLAGVYAVAHLKDHSPAARHRFIQGFAEGYHAAVR